jgi:tetratricopeptide (TPR) repeat protein
MVATAPYSPVAQFNLGLALLEAGHKTLARPRLEQAATLNPTLSRPRVLLALLDVSEGRIAEGLRRLDAIASSRPLERDYFVAHATAHLMAGHWHEAAVLARAGLQRFPKDAALTFRLAEALEGDSQLVEATSWYRRALLLYPDLVEAEVALGLLGLRLGQTQEANAHFRLALASQPDYAQAHRGLALVAEAAGDREESIRRWRHVLELATAGAPVREAMDHLRRLSQSDRGTTLDHAADGPPQSDAGSRR